MVRSISTRGLAVLLLVLAIGSAAAGDSLAVRLLYAFGREGDAAGQFRSPSALSLDPEGALYIADTGNNRIQKCTPAGAVVAMVGGFGWGENQFQRPVDLYAGNGLDLFIADYENRRVVRCDRELHWIDAYYFAAGDNDKLSLGFPAGIALSIHNDLFIADAENRRVLKVNAQREAQQSFGDFAEGEGELIEPRKLALDGQDRIYVCDRRRGCVVLYDYFGNYLEEIGSGVLKEPAGLCLIGAELLAVADEGRDQVMIFGRDGRLLCTAGTAGDKLGAFNDPADVAVRGDRMYVVESGNHRIQAFELQWLQTR
ncbi:MAG TPA: NHL repeat-containing protein [bacterium]|nr:NHL repeat-containing protein [bacterium]HPR86575.1 NHL repeat-containing protein [bacterium]